MYLEEAYNLFIEDRRSFCSYKTIDFYQGNLSRFICYMNIIDITRTEQLTQEALKQYLIYLRSKNVKSTSIRCYFRAINAFCSFCIDNDIMAAFKYKLKMPRPDPEQVLPLSQQEADIVINAIYTHSLNKTRDLLMFRLMIDCGLRSSEAINLKKSDIQGNMLIIRNSKYSKSRIVPVPDYLLELLLLYDPVSPDSFLGLTSWSIKNSFRRIKEWTGINRIHAHLLRHTFATSYMMKRGNIEFCRIYLGHEDYCTTKIYINLANQLTLSNYDIYRISDVFK